MTTRYAAIVAMDPNNVIGADGGLPWSHPRDLAHFRRITWGKVVIMGRKTFDSIPGGSLDGRRLIVMTRDPYSGCPRGVRKASSFRDAWNAAEALKSEEVIVAGGREVYAAFRDVYETVYLTRISTVVEASRGVVKFPSEAFKPTEWNRVAGWYDPIDSTLLFGVYSRKTRPPGLPLR